MRQTTLGTNLRLVRKRAHTPKTSQGSRRPVVEETRDEGPRALVDLLRSEEDLAWYAIGRGTVYTRALRSIPFGNTLKCISELLLRCASQTPITVDRGGIAFVASDQTSGRLIHIFLSRDDMLEFKVIQESLPFRCTLETSSIHNQSAASVCGQTAPCVGRVPSAEAPGQRGDVRQRLGARGFPGGLQRQALNGAGGKFHPSPRRPHTKHSTISVNPVQCTDYQIPEGYRSAGVCITSTILQRILREYRPGDRRRRAVCLPPKHFQARHTHREQLVPPHRSGYALLAQQVG